MGIPGLPNHWQHFLLCVLFRMLLPLLPLVIEYLITGAASEKTATLIAAIYVISIGSSSRSSLQFGLLMIVGVLDAVAFGFVVGQSPIPSSRNLTLVGYATVFAFWCVVAAFILHVLERYNRHVAERMPFWEFT